MKLMVTPVEFIVILISESDGDPFMVVFASKLRGDTSYSPVVHNDVCISDLRSVELGEELPNLNEWIRSIR